MSLTYEVGKYLESLGYGTTSVDIFGYEKPSKPDNIIVVIPNPGIPTEHMRNEDVQLIIRNNNSFTCESLANEIYEKLSYLKNVTLGVYHVYKINPTTEIIPLGFDDKHRYEISMNFNLKRRNK